MHGSGLCIPEWHELMQSHPRQQQYLLQAVLHWLHSQSLMQLAQVAEDL